MFYVEVMIIFYLSHDLLASSLTQSAIVKGMPGCVSLYVPITLKGIDFRVKASSKTI
jgi:hypothetical protein